MPADLLYENLRRLAVEDLLEADRLCVEPQVHVRCFMDHFGNRACRLSLPAGPVRIFGGPVDGSFESP